MSSKPSSSKLVIRFPPSGRHESSLSPAPSVDASQSTEPDPNLNESEDEEDDEREDSGDIEVDEEPQVDSSAPARRGRGRGRPRGSRGITLTRAGSRAGSGTPAPAAKIRGRGRGGRPRGRGRGRGPITLKLPKQDGEEEEETEGDGVGEDAGDDMNVDAAEESTKRAPLGGGKPFRKVQGDVYIIEGDQFITEDDPKGDEKIDKWGNLLGGRRFKASTFALPNRHPERRYMLAIEAARSSGYRDSLYYFRRNPLAFKLNATQPEKEYLISEGKLGPHLKTRSVTMITAQSAFKLHGSKMVIDGRWVTDDYYEDKALAIATELGIKPGDSVAELDAADMEGRPEKPARSLNVERDLGTSGGGLIYRPGGPTTIFASGGFGPFSDGPLNPVRKAMLNRDGVSEENWMWMMATRVREADNRWKKCRTGEVAGRVYWDITAANSIGNSSVKGKQKADLDADDDMEDGDAPPQKKQKVTFDIQEDSSLPLGVYEPHTGTVFFRSDTQPTRSRLEIVPVPVTFIPGSKTPRPDRGVLGGTKTGGGAWGLAYVDTLIELPPLPLRASRGQSDYDPIWEEKRARALKSVGIDLDNRGKGRLPGSTVEKSRPVVEVQMMDAT
ncbi:hypothetical protein D9757_000856 [Collybiopsis confluens]|uniref:Uncharacterized protein n=1 Tax=Collybiopsis confluens TaxID=2823264 RepID=A0A8H5I0P7_9AGAR|nr:hypothetical protein D9757_000856 [Collybiopsis confluens]